MKTKEILFSTALVFLASTQCFAMNDVNVNDTIVVETNTKTITRIDKQTGDTISITSETIEPNIESNESYVIDENNNHLRFVWQAKKDSDFTPHWSGFSFAFNGYDEDKIPLGAYKASLSYTYSFNISQYSMRLFNSNFGAFTGFGLDFSRYSFQDNVALSVVDGNTVFVPAPNGVHYKNSVLSANYVSIPLMLEYQVSNFHISGGGIGLVKFYSKSQIKYKDESGRTHKESQGRDMNLRPLDFRFRVQAGIGSVSFFANYSPMSIFRDSKGPELKPFSLGILLSM